MNEISKEPEKLGDLLRLSWERANAAREKAIAEGVDFDKIAEERERRSEEIALIPAIKRSGIKRKYEDVRLNNFRSDTKELALAYKFAANYINDFSDYTFTDWLVFLGNKGAGKTHTASVIANELMRKKFGVRYSRLSSLLQKIKMGYSTGENVLSEYLSVSLLILDEIGSSKLSEDDYRNFEMLIDERYQDELPCILISNLNDGEFFNFVGESISSRLSEMAKVVVFNGEDLRRRIERR